MTKKVNNNNNNTLPNCTLYYTDKDAVSGLVIHERYISISANESADELIKKAREAIE